MMRNIFVSDETPRAFPHARFVLALDIIDAEVLYFKRLPMKFTTCVKTSDADCCRARAGRGADEGADRDGIFPRREGVAACAISPFISCQPI